MRALVPAESKRRSAQGGSTAQAGYGQYTLCQSGAIFQFPPEQDGHRFPDDEGRGTVEMLIRAGRVLCIRETAEGIPEHTVALLRVLRQHGVPTDSIVMEDRDGKNITDYLRFPHGVKVCSAEVPRKKKLQSCGAHGCGWKENQDSKGSWTLWQPQPVFAQRFANTEVVK